MGCDIHFHSEVKIYGKWEHYGSPLMMRDYDLFAFMADVRNYNDITPISQPKGLPDDISVVTKVAAEIWGADGHSHSFLTGRDEIRRLEEFMKSLDKSRQKVDEVDENGKLINGNWYFYFPEKDLDYLFGGSWSGFYEYPKNYPPQIEDVRFVFWFDN